MTRRAIGLSVALLCVCHPAVAGPEDDAISAIFHDDYARALTVVRPEAERGHAWAEWRLGTFYETGTGVPLNYVKAVFWYRKAAQQRDGASEVALGRMYEGGEGVPQDDVLAETWVRKAIGQGFGSETPSISILANLMPSAQSPPQAVAARAARYRNEGDGGDGTSRKLLNMICSWRGFSSPPPDCAEVVTWARTAADQGDARAMRELGKMYDTGANGLDKDAAKATAWYLKAAETGDRHAESALGLRYRDGVGVAKDEAQSLAWLRKAADQGDGLGELLLASAYEDGHGVAKDDAIAFHWYLLLAKSDNWEAQEKVAMDYALGRGVAQNYVQAYRWLSTALIWESRSGREADADYTIALDGIAVHLTPAELNETKGLVAAWEASDSDRLAAVLKADQ